MREDPLHYYILRETSVKASAMKFLIILAAAAAAVARADRLEDAYLPPDSAGASAGLQAPLASASASAVSAVSAVSAASAAVILRYDSEISERGYRYAYETSDGTKAEQEGRVEEGSLRVSGSYSYVGEDSVTYSVTYTADEHGYRPAAAAALPAPAAMFHRLQLTDTSRGRYDSQRSSYDADAGY